jgi:hypothetical protein
MADVLRLVTRLPARRPVVVRDYQDVNTYFRVKDTFKYVAPSREPEQVGYTQRYGGKRAVGEAHDNASVQFSVAVQGATSDLGIASVETLLADLERFSPGSLFIEMRVSGATYSTFFEIRGPVTWNWNYNQPQFAGTTLSIVDLQVPVAPLAEMDDMDIFDDFSADSRTDYTFESGVIGDVTVTGGKLVGAGTLTTARQMIHTSRGHALTDVQDTVMATVGTTLTGFKAGVILHRSSATNYVEVYVDDNGTNSRARIDIVVAGVRTNRLTTNLTRLVAGQVFWIRGRIERYNLSSEFFSSAPTPTTTAASTLTDQMTIANGYTQPQLDALSSGFSGLTFTPQQAGASIDYFDHMPFTYSYTASGVRTLIPEYFKLPVIPGTAPALADVSITNAAGASSPPKWAMVAWDGRPLPYNYVWNGDFEDDANGWFVGALTGVQAVAGTSIARDTTAARCKFGGANAVIVTPASTGSGANFPLYRRFKAGQLYTLVLYASAAASTTSMVAKLGVSGDLGTSAAAALTTTPTIYTTTWTPGIDRDTAYVSFQTNAATATTCNIDGVMVYEGTVAPTLGRHAEGAGAVPPFGIIEAETSDTGNLAGWVITADGATRCGNKLHDTTVSGPEAYTAAWWIDPNLLGSDDFSQGEVDIEFWGRFLVDVLNITPRVWISVRPEWGTAFGAERFTAEYGGVGKLIVKPSSGTAWRRVRLGTITLPVDLAQPGRWLLTMTSVNANFSTGVFSLDYIEAVPVRTRVAGATGKPGDSTYPNFIPSTQETTRTIRSNLQGTVAKPTYYAQLSAGAMGGPPIELPVGGTDAYVTMSNLVPDDPTLDTTTDLVSWSGSVHFAVTPRVFLMRGS